MKIVLHHRISEQAAAQARAAVPAGASLVIVDSADSTGFAEQTADADVLWHVLSPVSAQDLANAPRLKLIHKFGVGVDTIDLEAARRADIAVCNMPGVNRQAVAEMTLTLILSVLRRVRELDERTRAGNGWDVDPTFFDRIAELSGRTVGFLGYGQIPQSLAPALTALGAHTIYHRRSGPLADTDAEYVEFDELVSGSDILSLHLPLTEQTTHIIDRGVLQAMKSGSMLINTGRGALIDDDALVEALRSGHLAGAGLDVFTTSPLPASHPFTELPTVTMTPHVAWLTPQTWLRSLQLAADAVAQLDAGRPLPNRVN